jgi:ATP-binding cassette subfamily B protein
MINKKKLIEFKDLFLILLNTLDKKRKKQIWLLFFLTLVTTFFEALTIGSIIPFLHSILDENYKFSFFNNIDYWFGLDNVSSAALIFGLLAIISAFLRIFLLKYNLKISKKTSLDLAEASFELNFNNKSVLYANENINTLISGIAQKINNVTHVIISIVTVVTYTILFFGISFALFFINIINTAFIIILFSIVFIIFSLYTKKKLSNFSFIIAKEQSKTIEILRESFSLIREILAYDAKKVFKKKFSLNINDSQNAFANILYLQQFPRFFFESFGIVFLLLLIFLIKVLGNDAEIKNLLPQVAALAFGAQKILPLLNQIYLNYAIIASNLESAREFCNNLENLKNLNNLKTNKIDIKESLEFKKINFNFKKQKRNFLLKDINIKIKINKIIAITGETGSGKSTIVNILMNFLKPTSGDILIDEKKINFSDYTWQQNFAYVSQKISLMNSSLKDNIIFGNKFSKLKYNDAILKARLLKFKKGKKIGYNIGDNAFKISGGEAQRISIARAIYSSRPFIIFDEPTSALDSKTESEIFRTIVNLKKKIGIILITHKISSLNFCDEVYVLKNNKLILKS